MSYRRAVPTALWPALWRLPWRGSPAPNGPRAHHLGLQREINLNRDRGTDRRVPGGIQE